MTILQTPVINLLTCIPDRDREGLFALGKVQDFAKGESIFRAGDASQNVFLLLKGRIKIYQPSTVGKEAILWFCFSGELFGLAEAARGGERVVSAQACDTCEVL